MKKLITFCSAILLAAFVFAQAPQKMSYQAVIRDLTNNLVMSQPIGMRISVLQGSSSGVPVYAETQIPNSNTNGLVSVEIGGGTLVSGNFSTIDWSNGPYFIKTETDPNGGTNYTITGTSELLSVPYALYSKTAESLSTKIAFNAGMVPTANQVIPGPIVNSVLVEMGPGNNYFNDGNGYDTTTNIFTPPVSGVYHLGCYVSYSNANPGDPIQLFLRSSGGWVARGVDYVGQMGTGIIQLDATINSAVTGGVYWVEIYSPNGLQVLKYDSGFSGVLIYKN
ncbi:hypothetical protein BH09BAC5_BH09BAC5_04610 [soil metagenome]